ncbi:sulfotransferase 6B1-like [Rhineura floridana]|uniref:sulfotransferase 6B1-like n=1 Tax=Rhineura floridana TaxID=261503 RepID=UPI002AC7E6D8|nr:sulfotransferase 6B1-like [Rhineura floridana]
MAQKKSSFVELIDNFFAANQENENEELLFTFRGVLYPNRLCSAKTFEALETMEARKDDILIVAYPKCGTNWALKIVNDMIAAVPSSKDLPPPENFQMLEFGPPTKVQDMKNQPSPRVYCTHLHYDNIPKSFIENKVKMLVILRNPKDAAVSYYHFYNKNPVLPNASSWDDFFQKFMSGEVGWKSYFDHALAWDRHMDEENIMLITYEELKQNLYEGVKQIADFYELPLSDETLNAIADNTPFQAMSNKSQETHGQFAPILFRKGVVGDWKTLFTEAQSQEMDAKFEECLAGTKLGAKLKYDKYCKF